jgi:branched-chain amino acid transport system permease protein
MVLFYGFMGSCWNILGGFVGMLSLCHATFAGISAYISTCLFMKMGLTPWIGMVLGATCAAVMGIALTYISSKYGLKRLYFAILTLAFGEIIRLLVLNWKFVGGASGLLIPMSKNPVLGFQFSEKIHYYYVILIMQVLVLVICYKLVRTKLGFYFLAIKEDEDAAEALGVNTLHYKIVGTAISAFLTGLGGVFYAQYLMYISSEVNLHINFSIEILSGPILGGIGTVFGPLVGAFALQVFSEVFRVYLGRLGGIHLIAYGLILMLVIIFMPKGFVGWMKETFTESKHGR